MTDYERSSQAHYRSYKPSRERTTDWVSRVTPKRPGQFVDPAMPPSDTESAFYSSDSDSQSSRSVPPDLVLHLPNGRQERVSGNYRSNANASLQGHRSRASSGPVNDYGHPPSHHRSRSSSFHTTSGHPQGPPFRPRSSNASPRPEEIRVLPAHRSTPGYVNPRPIQRTPVQPSRSRTSSVQAPSPRRAYHDSFDASHHGPPDNFATRHGPPQAISYSHSHPPSKYDMPTRDYSANGYRSSKLSRPPGSPISQMSLLTKENTIANSHSRTLARGRIEDDWLEIEAEEREKEQQREAYRRGRTSSQSSYSPTLTPSRSRTTSSSSRSNHYAPGPKVQLTAPEKFGPPPAQSTGTGPMKRPFFLARFFRVGSDKNLPTLTSPPLPNRLHRRHSTGGGSRR